MDAKYGKESIFATDLITPRKKNYPYQFQQLEISNLLKFEKIVRESKINHIINLSDIRPNVGELDHFKGTQIHYLGYENIFDIAKIHKCSVFSASSIIVYEGLPSKDPKPEDCILHPTTYCGVGKIYGELLGNYYNNKQGIDFRCIRYPILISSEPYTQKELARYMNEMFFCAYKGLPYTSYTNPDACLPAMHIDDCAKAIQMLIEADNNILTRRVYNLAGVKFTDRKSVV